MNIKYDREIESWINKHRDTIIADWIGISKIPAIKGDPEADAPFGKACLKALKACSDMFKKYGYSANISKDKSYSLVEFGNGEKTIGLFGHSDVVPVGDTWIYTKPFEPVLKDGFLIGRGVSDNKSGIMASLCALEIIKDLNIPIKSKIKVFIGSNEETGMEDIESFAKNEAMPDISLVLDAEFPCCVGEKWISQAFAKSEKRFSDVLDFCGGQAFNIVLDKVEARIKYSKEVETEIKEKIKDSEKFEIKTDDKSIVVLAKGISAHASQPENSINAAHLLAKLLSGVERISKTDRQIMKEAEAILSSHYGESVGIAVSDEVFGKLTFVNGIAKVEDGQLVLSFDIRYGIGIRTDELKLRLEEALGNLGWSVRTVGTMDGFEMASSPLPGVFEKIFEDITGHKKDAYTMGGGTYARFLKNAFSVGTEAEGKTKRTPPFPVPEGHGGAHQCDEMIDTEGFFRAVRIIVRYIIAIDEEINKGI